uniref:Uncharacterized protein n=1 Tax=Anguilla anguilla TaxID=7936 RepID=A0A0E9XL03_ANGAN
MLGGQPGGSCSSPDVTVSWPGPGAVWNNW